MKIVYKNLTLRQRVLKFLDILNSIQPPNKVLSSKEIRLLAEFLILPNAKFQYQRFGPQAKKLVMKNLAEQGWELRYQQVLAYIAKLVSKSILYRDEDRVIRINKTLQPHFDELISTDDYTVEFLFTDGNTD